MPSLILLENSIILGVDSTNYCVEDPKDALRFLIDQDIVIKSYKSIEAVTPELAFSKNGVSINNIRNLSSDITASLVPISSINFSQYKRNNFPDSFSCGTIREELGKMFDGSRLSAYPNTKVETQNGEKSIFSDLDLSELEYIVLSNSSLEPGVNHSLIQEGMENLQFNLYQMRLKYKEFAEAVLSKSLSDSELSEIFT